MCGGEDPSHRKTTVNNTVTPSTVHGLGNVLPIDHPFIKKCHESQDVFLCLRLSHPAELDLAPPPLHPPSTHTCCSFMLILLWLLNVSDYPGRRLLPRCIVVLNSVSVAQPLEHLFLEISQFLPDVFSLCTGFPDPLPVSPVALNSVDVCE